MTLHEQHLTRVALRHRALFLNVSRKHIDMSAPVTPAVAAFAARLRENGFCLDEELLRALTLTSANRLADITALFREVMGVDLNWTPLVKGWDTPTGETRSDHLITLFANLLGPEAGFRGTTLPCGHLIPEGTFPLERYNGCPFCGKPFTTAGFVYYGQGSKLKVLRLFTLTDLRHVFSTLLSSATPLDGTQRDSLSLLLQVFKVPKNAHIPMKETTLLVIRSLEERDLANQAAAWLRTPGDILRYLWYEQTGQTQIIEPRTLIAHSRKLYGHLFGPLDRGADAAEAMRRKLRLKFHRSTCRNVAQWFNTLPMTVTEAAEAMHPKRGMWVRMIHALRLGAYSRKRDFFYLQGVLDVFYHKDYTPWQARVDQARTASDPETTLTLLRQRPGLFARCLFSTMLRFGSERTLAAFAEVADSLPARLLLSLGNAADLYFDPHGTRVARPLTGGTHVLAPHKLLALYSEPQLHAMAEAVNRLYTDSMLRRFAAQPTASRTIFIDPLLFDIPVSVGDRSATLQDASCALQGTRFPVEGDAVRLFLQWGKGLHAQALDIDLSCRISLPDDKVAECAFYNLTCVGAKHSGDIRSIPEMVGTAEYIELSLPELEAAHAGYVTFTCNAYSTGSLSPNLMVGWMDSAHPMTVSDTTGVAYDPSCVSHMVRISESNLSKGLVFGILDVARREIIWLEMPFTAQTLRGCSTTAVEGLLRKLRAKLSVGRLLELKAEAQHLTPVSRADEADEAYTYAWALNPAEVSQLLAGNS